MKKTIAAGVVMLCAATANVSARTPDDFATAWAACESGRVNTQYREAVDACWGAYGAAMTKRDYPAAFAAAAKGCEKYKRADYCSFMTQLPQPAARGGVVRVGTDQTQLGRNLARAESRVHPTDVEDGEVGYYMKRSGVR